MNMFIYFRFECYCGTGKDADVCSRKQPPSEDFMDDPQTVCCCCRLHDTEVQAHSCSKILHYLALDLKKK